MYARLITFDGPRSDEQIAASATAGRDRIGPLMHADPICRDGLVAGFRGVGEDGSEVVFVVATTTEVLARMEQLATTSELLPGEQPELLSGPSRVAVYEVTDDFSAVTK